MSRTDTNAEFTALYERYASLVHRRCRSILHSEDDAWDATQEVFIKLMNNLATIEKWDSIYSWLLSASTNHCISLLRKKKTEEFDEGIHSHDNESSHNDKRLAIKEILTHFMKPWDQKMREVVIYALVDEYTNVEVAELTGLGESTVRKYLSQFKEKSKKIYERLDIQKN